MELDKMKAITRQKYGYSDVIKVSKVNKPNPKADEVLIKVHVTTVNRTDCAILTGKPFVMRVFLGLFSPKIEVTGTDFAGEIISVGEKEKIYKKGDLVFGFKDLGLRSQAEYMTLKTNQPMSTLPERLSCMEAVTALEGMHYAYNMINKVSIKPRDKILINGASGAIGSSLVQIAKSLGAYITVVCSSNHKDLMEYLKVDQMIDYKIENFTKSNESYDFVFDAVGKSSFSKCKPILKDKGIYISSEPGDHGQNLFLSLITPILGGKKVIFPFPSDIKRTIKYAKKLIEEDNYRPVIDRTYTLDETAEAYDYVFSGHKKGSVIIEVNPS